MARLTSTFRSLSNSSARWMFPPAMREARQMADEGLPTQYPEQEVWSVQA
jgi:hypothetical protein